MTKNREFLVFMETPGIDPESKTDSDHIADHNLLSAAFRSIPDNVRVYQYLVKTQGSSIDQSSISDHARINYLVSGGQLCTIKLYTVFSFATRGIFSVSDISKDQALNYAEDAKTTADVFRRNLRGICPLVTMKKEKAFLFLRFLLSLDPKVAGQESLQFSNHTDYWCTSSPIIPLRTGIAIGETQVSVATLRHPPEEAWPGMLEDLLTIDGTYVWCAQMQRVSTEKMKHIISRSQDHMNSVGKWIKDPRSAIAYILSKGKHDNLTPDAATLEEIEELNQASIVLLNDYMVRYSLTGVFFDPYGQGKRHSAITDAVTLLGSKKGSLIKEQYWAFGAYCNVIPGTHPRHNFRQRDKYVSGAVSVDMSLLYNHSIGNRINQHLQQEYLMPLTTKDHTVYYWNMHEDDLMGLLIFGRPGSGKSVTANAAIDSSMKYNPMTLILDGMGSSYRTLTTKHGGKYFELDPEGDWPFTINPFAFDPTRKTFQYVAMLLRICMATGGYRATAKKNLLLYRAVQKVFSNQPEARSLSFLELPEDMMVYLAPWLRSEDGPYSFVFDNPRNTLSLDGSLQTIDFSSMDDFPDVVQPLLFHLFYCWGNVVYDNKLLGVLKQLFVDEGHKMLSYPAARRFIKTAGRTWRKRNGGIVLITQSIVELQDTNMLSIINELCPTKLLLYNPGGDFSRYSEVFKLNEKELANYRSLRGKGDMMQKTDRGSKVLHLDLDPKAYWTYTNNKNDNPIRDQYITKFGFEEGIEKLADEHPVSTSAVA